MNKRLQTQRKTFGLTPRELQIVAAVVEGGTNKESRKNSRFQKTR